ncbi:uncharacterized protein A4U43_UnF2580 [Asparagus officinalis]|uniref:Uncharacterized protein n=1 Tax=Asparagus officinalis TaxID=4686 RepID=A0A1R3L783_ASPOF|nr:uncharacterized protein A4U43_UnF2580 [Asparagus officinalis]
MLKILGKNTRTVPAPQPPTPAPPSPRGTRPSRSSRSSWGPSGVLEAGGGDDVDEEGRRAPTMPPRPEKGKLRHGWRGATWQSERAWKESGRTWTREVERMTPAAKDLIRVRVLGEEGEFLKRRERVTGAEIAGGS